MKCLLWVLLGVALLAEQSGAKLVTRTIEYKVDGVAYRSYLAYEDTIQGRRPGVLVFPEWWGLVEFPRHKAEQLAHLGYTALAADMYGEGRTTDNPQEAARMAGQVKPEQMRQRAKAALEALREQEVIDGERIAAIGFCFGGKVALELAYNGADIKAVVTFHGELTPPSPEELKDIKAQILVCTGTDDPMAPPQKVEAFWSALRGSPVAWQINLYSGAKHSFTNPAANRYHMEGIGYNATAAERSWSAMQLLFREVLVPPPATRTRAE